MSTLARQPLPLRLPHAPKDSLGLEPNESPVHSAYTPAAIAATNAATIGGTSPANARRSG